MLDYSQYHTAMIAIADRGYAFIYWVSRWLAALDKENYGRGKSHWVEYLGKYSRKDCIRQYPETPILESTDPKINEFIREKIKEMYDLVQD